MSWSSLGYPLVLSTLLFSGAVSPAKLETPENVTVITAPEVKYLVEKGELTLVNSLSRIEFEIQRIPGSINVPVTEMEQSDRLPADRSQPIAFYCMGRRCTYSERATRKAVAMGYENVFWFHGGIPEWRRFNYPMAGNEDLHNIPVPKLSPPRVQEILAEASPFVLDVRPLWWDASRAVLPRSHFIPLVELDRRYRELPRDREIVIVDGAMMQAPSAARFLIAKGYSVLGVLKGGILRWEYEGLPAEYREAADEQP